jgi:thioredoxin 1
MISASGRGDINSALEDGPVLVMIGFDGCFACKAQKPILEEISAEYQDRASVMYIDTTKVGALGFSVYSVPDSFVIVGIEEGTYVYMKSDGQTTTNREEARFIGLTRKAVLTQTLDHALEERSKNPQQTDP